MSGRARYRSRPRVANVNICVLPPPPKYRLHNRAGLGRDSGNCSFRVFSFCKSTDPEKRPRSFSLRKNVSFDSSSLVIFEISYPSDGTYRVCLIHVFAVHYELRGNVTTSRRPDRKTDLSTEFPYGPIETRTVSNADEHVAKRARTKGLNRERTNDLNNEKRRTNMDEPLSVQTRGCL